MEYQQGTRVLQMAVCRGHWRHVGCCAGAPASPGEKDLVCQAAEAEEPNYPVAPVLRAGQAKRFLPGQSKVPVTHLHLLSTHGLGANIYNSDLFPAHSVYL